MDNNKGSNKIGGIVGGIITILLGYGWFSMFEEVKGDTRWVVELIGWSLYIFGLLIVLSVILPMIKEKFPKK